MDAISIVDLEIFATHGVFAEENELGQKFLISATLYADLAPAGASDALEDSIDYGAVCHLIDKRVRSTQFKLIERVAQDVADAVLAAYPAVQRIAVEVKKPWAPIGLPVAYASVRIERSR